MTSAGKATELLAKARGAQPTDSFEEFADDDTRAAGMATRIARSGYGKLPVYKLTSSGCQRIYVAVQSLHEVLSHPNYAAVCFDCGEDDCCAGKNDTVNDCPGRAPRKFRICPIPSCRKKVYDNKPTGKFAMDEFDHSDRPNTDENAIQDDHYTESTPETRTKGQMDMHLIGFHPQEAMELGLSRPMETPRLAVVS